MMLYKKELSGIELFIEFIKDPERKSLAKILGELLLLAIKFRSFPRHYFSRYLFKKGRNNIFDFFPDKYFDRIKPLFNDKELRDVLENKLYFHMFFSQFGLEIPKLLMYNHGHIFVTDKNVIEIHSCDDFRRILFHLFKENICIQDSIFIKKTGWSYGGNNIQKLSLDELNEDCDKVKELYSNIVSSGYVFQETIKQHPEMKKLNPSCLNTIRIDTFINKEKRAEIMSAYLRTSSSNLIVDNISSGGYMIPVNISTGQLEKFAYSVLKVHGVKLITQHPVSKLVFEDFHVPYFEETKNLVVRAAHLIPNLRLVGWDVGISEKGPVMIEGNSDYVVAGNDLSFGGYRNNPVFRKVIAEMNGS